MSFQNPDAFCMETTHGQEGLSMCSGKNQTCWEGYMESSSIYILSVPMTLALAVSLFIRSVQVVLSDTVKKIASKIQRQKLGIFYTGIALCI